MPESDDIKTSVQVVFPHIVSPFINFVFPFTNI